MSFIGATDRGVGYAPGWFLAHEECERKTRQISQASATTTALGAKYMKMGSFYPANDASTVEGIVYEDVDVTNGDMPGSVVLKGTVYLDRLPVAPASGVQAALEAKGFTFIAATPAVTRPAWPAAEIEVLTVASIAGTAAGDTKVTVTGHSLATGEGYVYKVGDAAETVIKGDVLSGWTSWNGTADITAATDKIITVAVVDGTGRAVAAGSKTVVAKA